MLLGGLAPSLTPTPSSLALDVHAFPWLWLRTFWAWPFEGRVPLPAVWQCLWASVLCATPWLVPGPHGAAAVGVHRDRNGNGIPGQTWLLLLLLTPLDPQHREVVVLAVASAPSAFWPARPHRLASEPPCLVWSLLFSPFQHNWGSQSYMFFLPSGVCMGSSPCREHPFLPFHLADPA